MEFGPSGGFVRDETDAGAFGYVCFLFGRSGPRCDERFVRLVGRWRKGSKCRQTLMLHRAPWTNPQHDARDLGDGRPGEPLVPVTFPSDGRVFGFLRLGAYVLEAESCFGREKAVAKQLVQWAAVLQPEVFDSNAAR